jgi:cardiolipin synthase
VWVSVGTMNFDNRSLALDDEATLMALDPGLGRAMEDVFRADPGRAEEIRLEAFRARPRLARVAEWGANLLAPLL